MVEMLDLEYDHMRRWSVYLGKKRYVGYHSVNPWPAPDRREFDFVVTA